MKLDEVLKLIDAGYTKEDIENLASEKEKDDIITVGSQEETKEEYAEEKEPDQVPANENKKDPELDPLQTKLDELTKAMQKMSNSIISSNLNRSVSDSEPEKTLDDILASVINPPTKKGGK